MNELSILDSLFNDVLGTTPGVMYNSYNSPRVDVSENTDSYLLEMELPGRTEEDVNIELDQDKLTIASKEKGSEKKEDKKAPKYLLKERRYGSFERKFTLPNDVDSEQISANFKNGVLSIKMTKKTIAAPKKIAIEAC